VGYSYLVTTPHKFNSGPLPFVRDSAQVGEGEVRGQADRTKQRRGAQAQAEHHGKVAKGEKNKRAPAVTPEPFRNAKYE